MDQRSNRWTAESMDGPMDGPRDGTTDRVFYRNARTDLKGGKTPIVISAPNRLLSQCGTPVGHLRPPQLD